MGLGADVVLTPRDDGESFFDSPEARAEVAEVQAAVAALPNVLGTSDPAGALAQGREAAVDSGVVSPDGQVALIRVQYPEREDLSASDLDRLEAVLDDLRQDTSLQIEAGGDLHFAFEQPPAGLGEALGLLAAVVILLVAFGSVVAMGLPIGTALLGLAVGAGSLSLVAYVVDIPAWATVIGAMVGLGVGIDYPLFVLTRFREHLAEGRSVEDAVGLSLATAGRSVVFAGGTVVVALLGLAVARIPFVTAGGIGISWVVLVMVLASITLLPALLGLAGHRVNGRRQVRAERRQRALASVGRARRSPRGGVRPRCHHAAAGAGGSDHRAPPRLPGRGHHAAVAHRAPRLRPRRGRASAPARTDRCSSPSTSRATPRSSSR